MWAAVSLKHAGLRDLPSSDLSNEPTFASTAASPASPFHKPTSRWRTDPQASAYAAAVLAGDLRSAKPWQPEPSVDSVKAALLAHTRNLEISTSSNSTLPQIPSPSQGLNLRLGHRYTATVKRQRSESAPTTTTTWPDPGNSTANALSAATTAHNPSMKTAIVLARGPQSSNKTVSMPLDFSRIHSIAKGNATRDLTNTHTPLAQGSTGMNRADVRAAAVSMARQFSVARQSPISDTESLEGKGSQRAPRGPSAQTPSSSPAQAGEHAPMHFDSLEEAASKLASKRLARLHNEHKALRNRHGINQAQPSPIRSEARRRAFSAGQCTATDEEQSRRIRSEMSLLTGQVAQVDAKKGGRGCTSLIATAHKNVQACMHKMDEKILSDTGRLAPSMQEEWKTKAFAAAEAQRKSRMSYHDQVDVGGGKFVDQKEVDAAAVKNVQPLLDEINERMEKQRVKLEDIRLEREQKTRIAEEEKLWEREANAERKRIKGEHSTSRLEKLGERTKKVEQKRIRRAAKRHLKRDSTKQVENEQLAAAPRGLGVTETIPPVTGRTTHRRQDELPVLSAPAKEGPNQSHDPREGHVPGDVSPASPMSDHKTGVKKWLKGKFSKRTNEDHRAGATEVEYEKASRGGPVLTGLGSLMGGSEGLEERSSSLKQFTTADRNKPPLRRSRDNEVCSSSECFVGDNGRQRGSVSLSLMPDNEENVSLSYSCGQFSSKDNGYEDAKNIFGHETVLATTSSTDNPTCKRSTHDSKFIENL